MHCMCARERELRKRLNRARSCTFHFSAALFDDALDTNTQFLSLCLCKRNQRPNENRRHNGMGRITYYYVRWSNSMNCYFGIIFSYIRSPTIYFSSLLLWRVSSNIQFFFVFSIIFSRAALEGMNDTPCLYTPLNQQTLLVYEARMKCAIHEKKTSRQNPLRTFHHFTPATHKQTATPMENFSRWNEKVGNSEKLKSI